MKKIIRFGLLIICSCLIFFACSKSNDINTSKTKQINAEKELSANLNVIASRYKQKRHLSTKQLGTWGGVSNDIIAGLGGAELGFAGGPIACFCLGVSFGICASAFDRPHFSTYVDPCTGTVEQIQYNYTVSAQNIWNNNYNTSPDLITGNPYFGQGYFHNVILTQTHCAPECQNASTAQIYSIIGGATISYLANNHLPLDSGLILNSKDNFVKMMGLLGTLNQNDTDYVNKAINILEVNNFASDDITTQTIAEYNNIARHSRF